MNSNEKQKVGLLLFFKMSILYLSFLSLQLVVLAIYNQKQILCNSQMVQSNIFFCASNNLNAKECRDNPAAYHGYIFFINAKGHTRRCCITFYMIVYVLQGGQILWRNQCLHVISIIACSMLRNGFFYHFIIYSSAVAVVLLLKPFSNNRINLIFILEHLNCRPQRNLRRS